MLISDLNDRLRALIGERIDARELTGTELARRAGFRQAHISNFMNSRRGLSIESMDRLMQVLGLDVRDLMPVERRAPLGASDAGFEAVPVVMAGALLQSEFTGSEVLEFLRFKKSFLRRLRPEPANQRGNWQRFVMLRADRDSGEAMRPRLLPGAMMLIDRQYNSLRSYRKREPNLYVVKKGAQFVVRYVELQGSQLTLRPENQRSGLDYVELAKGKTFADYVVGRVAHIAIET
jgi:transcriptional regulator with XRE-family HTH domain